ncbi:hypothetical protein NDU88_006946 [Pleurodeles waltl]|uniref:Uncharacterized protein n=1 Tax=Pleurodeles waltl TaxID=8319 RepID=A0AAV7NVY4_PLEWA|nr:hypothetical protein NDU88_006946 [Pleurodeles waltl]
MASGICNGASGGPPRADRAPPPASLCSQQRAAHRSPLPHISSQVWRHAYAPPLSPRRQPHPDPAAHATGWLGCPQNSHSSRQHPALPETQSPRSPLTSRPTPAQRITGGIPNSLILSGF